MSRGRGIGFSWPTSPGAIDASVPPISRYTSPATRDVTARAAMLKAVRWSGFFPRFPTVHCTQALTAAMTIVACGPSRSSAANSNANDDDSVAPWWASGRSTLKTDAIAEAASRLRKMNGCE